MRDSFVSRLKERPLAATLTLTIHLFEHELHAQFTRLRVLVHSSIYTAFLVKGPTVPSSSLFPYPSFALHLLNAPLYISYMYRTLFRILSHTLFPLPFPISRYRLTMFVLPSSFVLYLVPSSAHPRGSLSWPDPRMSNCIP